MLVSDCSFTQAIAPASADEVSAIKTVSSLDIAMIVHELRNPLLAILGYSRMMADSQHKVPNSEWSRRIEDTGTHMLGLVNDLLELSKTGAPSFDLRHIPVNTLRLATDSLDVVETRAQTKGLTLRLDLDYGFPLEFLGDPQRLRQILINLLSNAVTFTARGCVTLRAFVDLANARLCFSVIDEGVGMTDEDVNTLFQPYRQVRRAADGPHGGTGLGLAISQNLATAMGGMIQVVSAPDKGSSFTFSLPYCTRADEQAPAGRMQPSTAAPVPDALPPQLRPVMPNLPPQRCLVVDDNDLVRDLIVSILQRGGHSVDAASSGAEALQRFADNAYDLVLLDHLMRDMDGFETARQIRRITTRAQCPILIGLSAVVTPEDEAGAAAAGMNAIFAKTDSPTELIRTIARIVQASGRK